MTRQTGIIITIALAIIVACPSIFCCLFGAISTTGRVPFEFNGQTTPIPSWIGLVVLLGQRQDRVMRQVTRKP